MVADLRERQDLRNLFGRYVGEDVARRAIETGTELGGEERYVRGVVRRHRRLDAAGRRPSAA